MAEKKKNAAASGAGKKKKTGKSGANWKGRRDDNKSGLFAVIAVISLIAILAGALLQDSSLFSRAESSSESSVNILLELPRYLIELQKASESNLNTVCNVRAF